MKNKISILSAICSNTLSLAVLPIIFLVIFVVMDRYFIQSGKLTFLREAVIYIHAVFFMLGIVLCLNKNGHARIDVIYARLSNRGKLWIDCLGIIILLLPVCITIFITSIGFVASSWQIQEVSAEPGGIAYVYILKTLIPIQAILLIALSLCILCKKAYQLTKPI